MELIPEEEIWPEVFKRYNRNSLGMRMFSGLSSEGYPELLIRTPEISWLLKRESLYSGKLGIGGNVESEIPKPPETLDYGFRPVSLRFIKKLFAMLQTGVPPEKVVNLIYDMIHNTISRQPQPLDKINSPLVINGPIPHADKPLSLILGGQTELYSKLDHELSKLKRHLPYV